MAVLEERGLFWWNDQRVAGDVLVPGEPVGGLLTIEDDGRVHLELDGVMPSNTIPMASVLDGMGKPSTKNIQGLLKRSNEYALLVGLSQSGGQARSHGISFAKYVAKYCLLGSAVFRQDGSRPQKFHSLKVSLNGYEGWLRLSAIAVTRRRTSLVAKYRKVKDVRYKEPSGRLAVEFDMNGPAWGRQHKVDLREFANLIFAPPSSIALEECQKYHQMLQDILILLTDSDYNLEWPQLITADGKKECRLYFWRNQSSAQAPAAHECLINFLQIRDDLGAIFANWMRLREQYGPGVYLYLGTRRGVKLFIEHRFVNLIWGLEAFDRHVRGATATPSKLQAKIDRIMKSIGSADGRWLAGRLKHAAEPNLAERLFKIFVKLPLRLDKAALGDFCEQCAKRRNEISHYGGFHPGRMSYDSFIRDLNNKSNALAALYHVLLLTTVGVKISLLDIQTNKSWRASVMKRHLDLAGLLKGTDEARSN